MLTKQGHGKRARRRQDSARMKARARRIYPHDVQARCANHLKVCSCYMCGNPRRHFNSAPIPEIRAEMAATAQIHDT